jgi:hypothetical protein
MRGGLNYIRKIYEKEMAALWPEKHYGERWTSVFNETVAESSLGFADVYFGTWKALDGVHNVLRGAGEGLYYVFFGAM